MHRYYFIIIIINYINFFLFLTNTINYTQTLLITKINIPKESPLHLTLVQWYDYQFQKKLNLYECPLLKLVEWYNLIEIEAIEDIVHVIPRFDKTNEYFVNKYLF